MDNERPQAGRPRSAAKAEAILAAAGEVFLGAGFAAASMDAVAERAGVSKATVYSRFGSKKELFAAAVERHAGETLEKFRDAVAGHPESPRQALEAFAVVFQERLLTTEVSKWHRLVIAEAERHPDLARGMFRAGPAQGLGLVAEYLERQHSAGTLNVPDPPAAAEHFLGLVGAVDIVRGLLASNDDRTPRQRARRAASAVGVFLAAYGKPEG